jgi:hypothetical protein
MAKSSRSQKQRKVKEESHAPQLPPRYKSITSDPTDDGFVMTQRTEQSNRKPYHQASPSKTPVVPYTNVRNHGENIQS